jgi:large subunit ribosomal protein L22
MGKKSAPRVLADNAAKAHNASIRVSPQKLNLVAASIRGLAAGAALAQLTFSKRRVAQEVKKVLQSAIANAENNHQLDVDRLIVSEAFVGRGLVMKRFSPRARGRAGKIMKPFSNLTVIVREGSDAAAEGEA